MPKKVKTRKQKKLADLRRIAIHPETRETDLTTYSLPVQNISPKHVSASVLPTVYAQGSKTHATTVDYRYLITDLRKTMLLTFSVVIAELVIRFTIKGI